jgi:glycosyltransferase involved in cell wall biosynthesis
VARLTDRCTFLAVGYVSEPPGREGNLVRAGAVEDLQLCFDAADVSLVPVGYGGGTKLKLVESLAAAKPTVAFAEATLGLDVRHEEHLLVSPPDERSLVEAIHRLLDDDALAERLGSAARRYAEENLAWSSIAATVEESLERLVDGSAGGRAATAAPLSAAPRG